MNHQPFENLILNNRQDKVALSDSIRSFNQKIYSQSIESKPGLCLKKYFKQSASFHQSIFTMGQLYEMKIEGLQDLLFILLFQNRKKKLNQEFKQNLIIIDQQSCLHYVLFSEDYQLCKQLKFSKFYETGQEEQQRPKKVLEEIVNSRQIEIKKLVKLMLNFEVDCYYLLQAHGMQNVVRDAIAFEIAQELKAYGIQLKKVDQNDFILSLDSLGRCSETAASSVQELKNILLLQKKSIKEIQSILEQQELKEALRLNEICFLSFQELSETNSDQLRSLKVLTSSLYKIDKKKFISLPSIKKIKDQKISEKIVPKQALHQLSNQMPKDQSNQMIKQIKIGQFENKKDFSCRLIQKPGKVEYSQYLKEVSIILQKGHLGSLKNTWNHGLLDTLKFLERNWQVYSFQIYEQIKTVINLIDYKINKFKLNLNYQSDKKHECIEFSREKVHKSLFQGLYPGAQQIVSSYLKILEIKCISLLYEQYKKTGFHLSSLSRQEHFQQFITELANIYKIVENPVDQLITKYALERLLQIKSPQPKQSWVKKQGISKPLYKCIYQQSEFNNGTSQFQDILTFINNFIEQEEKDKGRRTPSQKDSQNLKKIQTRQNYIQSIEFQKTTHTICLGCSTFFYFKKNIQDFSVNQTPLKIFPSIKKLKDYQSMIKSQICAMLNNGGGVLLFACQAKYKKVNVIGQKLTERNKQDYEQTVQFMVRSFYPRIEYNNQIQLTFVPVVESPQTEQTPSQIQHYKGEEGIIKQNQCYVRRNYMKGVYVARIRVNPTQSHLTYLWESIDSRFFSSTSKNNKTVQLKGNQLIKVLKRKFRHNFSIQNQHLSRFQQQLIKQPWSCFSNPCQIPQGGYKIRQIDSSHERATIKKEDIFNYMSLLIVKQRYINEVQKKLKAKNIEFFIEQRFKSYKFHSAKGTYILYHNINFDQLLKAVSYDKEFMFQGKITIVIYISEYLKFGAKNSSYMTCPINLPQRLNAANWLQVQFPNESLKFYEYKTLTGMQYYASTDTRMSTLFMYYLFNSYNQYELKTLLKSPQNLSDLSPEERNRKWKEIPSPNSHILGSM